MNWMTRVLGYAIAFAIASIVVVVTLALFGTALLGAAATILAIPLAFPLTTVLVLLAVGGGVAWTYMRRNRSTHDQEG